MKTKPIILMLFWGEIPQKGSGSTDRLGRVGQRPLERRLVLATQYRGEWRRPPGGVGGYHALILTH